MGRLFGTDGVRGVAGTELTRELAHGLGRAAVVVLGRHGAGNARLVVGRDTRESGEWLEDALTEGIREAGGDVLLAGVEPTPAVAFMTVDLGASSGVVISASHNPAEDNGIKFFARDGMKLPDRLEDEIEAELARPADPSIEPGEILPVGDARERYLRHLEGAAEARLDGMTVVVDCANGAASQMAPEVLRRLGAEVHAINAAPDGRNINDGCGALHPEVVAAEVVRIGARRGRVPRRRRRSRAVRRRRRRRDRRRPGPRGVGDRDAGAGRARRRRGGRDRDVEPRARDRDARCRDRAGAHRRRATATSSRRWSGAAPRSAASRAGT